MSEELLVRHCSPTLAGIKTGNLFSCRYDSVAELFNQIRQLNTRLTKKGLRILPLRFQNGNALIYVYRPEKLRKDISYRAASEILRQYGYSCSTPERCVAHLIDRLDAQADFPHEIGLFLGYPPEDVRGFIDNNAKACKCSGLWKVYGDRDVAERLFAKYKKCTDVYLRQLNSGNSLDRLTVAT